MSKVIPLISAAALVPMIRWMHLNGRSVASRLEAVDLGYFPFEHPERPIPLLNAVEFLRRAARAEGPDFGCRVITATSVRELAMLGQVALGAQTPREALQRVITALPRHCTHEQLSLVASPDGVLVHEVMQVPLDDEALHFVHQFNASMIRSLLAMTAAREPLLTRIEMVPHPEFGLEHLHRWFGGTVAPAESRAVVLTVPKRVMDGRFPTVARDRSARLAGQDWPDLRGDGRLTPSARLVTAAMLPTGEPTLQRIAMAAGTSVRTLQRRLQDEGSSFSQLLEEVRHRAAMAELADGSKTIGEVSQALGYAGQSALTRAVRRWSGETPSRLRAGS